MSCPHTSLGKRVGTVPDRDGLCKGQIAGIQDGPIYFKSLMIVCHHSFTMLQIIVSSIFYFFKVYVHSISMVTSAKNKSL